MFVEPDGSCWQSISLREVMSHPEFAGRWFALVAHRTTAVESLHLLPNLDDALKFARRWDTDFTAVFLYLYPELPPDWSLDYPWISVSVYSRLGDAYEAQ